MKVLAIMGSPRKGNSFKATQMIEAKLKAFGGIEFEYLFLKDADLKMCRGCHTCFTYGEEKCPLKDDRDAIIEKMHAADGILFVSPSYSQMVTALMKNFLDRTTFFWHRPAFFRQKAAVIGVGGGMFKELLAYLKMCAKSIGMKYAGSLSVPHLEDLTPKFHAKIMKDFDKFAWKFYKALKDERPRKPGVGDIAWFQIWKVNMRYFGLPRDVEYWNEQGWLDKPYFTADKVGPFKRMFGWLFGKMMAGVMRSIYRYEPATGEEEAE